MDALQAGVESTETRVSTPAAAAIDHIATHFVRKRCGAQQQSDVQLMSFTRDMHVCACAYVCMCLCSSKSRPSPERDGLRMQISANPSTFSDLMVVLFQVRIFIFTARAHSHALLMSDFHSLCVQILLFEDITNLWSLARPFFSLLVANQTVSSNVWHALTPTHKHIHSYVLLILLRFLRCLN